MRGQPLTQACDLTLFGIAELMNRCASQNAKERAKIEEERKAAKQMEAQYWLEMVDSKHRFVGLQHRATRSGLMPPVQLRHEPQMVPPALE